MKLSILSAVQLYWVKSVAKNWYFFVNISEKEVIKTIPFFLSLGRSAYFVKLLIFDAFLRKSLMMEHFCHLAFSLYCIINLVWRGEITRSGDDWVSKFPDCFTKQFKNNSDSRLFKSDFSQSDLILHLKHLAYSRIPIMKLRTPLFVLPSDSPPWFERNSLSHFCPTWMRKRATYFEIIRPGHFSVLMLNEAGLNNLDKMQFARASLWSYCASASVDFYKPYLDPSLSSCDYRFCTI